jgi:tail assembly chaperone
MDHKKVEIDGVEYIILHPKVEVAAELGFEIAAILGESVASLATGDFTAGTKAFFTKLKPKEAFSLMSRVLSTVEAQSTPKMMLDKNGIEKHFHGKTGSMVKVFAATLAFTHADFFVAIQETIADAMKKIMEKM